MRVLTAIALFAPFGGVIEILVTVAGLAVFGMFVFDDFGVRVDLFSATIAGVRFFPGGGTWRLFAGGHARLPDGERAILLVSWYRRPQAGTWDMALAHRSRWTDALVYLGKTCAMLPWQK